MVSSVLPSFRKGSGFRLQYEMPRQSVPSICTSAHNIARRSNMFHGGPEFPYWFLGNYLPYMLAGVQNRFHNIFGMFSLRAAVGDRKSKPIKFLHMQLC
jgi:hypothetical protein